MKVLVAYYSQSGNTEQIAKAIQEEASKAHDVQLKKVEEVQPDTCKEHDVIFIGSPIHATGLAGPVTTFVTGLPQNPSFKVAGFITHGSPSFERTTFENALTTFDTTCKDKGINLKGCFECQGKLAPILHDMVKQARGLSDEEFKTMMAEADKHPSPEDEEQARQFARNILTSV